MQDWAFQLFSWWCGKLVGTDSFGNRYFQHCKKTGNKTRRWVVYKGREEASKVPAEWHGWLHHRRGNPPNNDYVSYCWQLPHLPNLNGTIVPNTNPQKTPPKYESSNYQPWTPS